MNIKVEILIFLLYEEYMITKCENKACLLPEYLKG